MEHLVFYLPYKTILLIQLSTSSALPLNSKILKKKEDLQRFKNLLLRYNEYTYREQAILAGVINNGAECLSGTVEGLPARVGLVSFEAQAALIDAELKKDDADIMDVISEGTPVREILYEDCQDTELAEQLIEKFGLAAS